ncbi:MAG: class I SAM-dependent methyltransferase [Solirubrobacteraceae bacterium]
MSDSDAISPTAHYTGYVWARNGLSTPELTTTEGRILFESLHPLMVLTGKLGRPSLEAYLLARHVAIDALLERAIEQDQITQVLEVAAGLSPRGWRFAQRYGDRVTYIEADLPAMASRKREALERAASLTDNHRVRDLDALQENGLAELEAELDPHGGLAIITEGLLGYLSPGDMSSLWRRFAATLARFSAGHYISDLHIGSAQTIEVRGFRIVLSAFVRGRVYLHFGDAAEAEAALRQAGFESATVRPANAVTGERRGRGVQMADILEASTV